jgi:hypothetical protein
MAKLKIKKIKSLTMPSADKNASNWNCQCVAGVNAKWQSHFQQ